MAEYQSIFTGQQVDNALSKLRDWINTDGSYPTVTVDGITYAVVWKVLPTSSNQVYGIGLHPTTGRVYQIYNNKGVYSATALDFYVDTKNTAGSSNSDSKLFIIGASTQAANPQTYSNSAVYTQNGKLYSNNTEVSVAGHTHSFDTITNRGEAFLSWGGKNFSGTYGPIDAAMVPELGANRLAFMPAKAVTIEYSRDGGSTWTDYGPTDSQKIDLFNGRGSSFTIGKATSGEGNIATNQYQLRVNIYTSAGHVYTALNKFVIYLSTSGTNNNWCTIRARKQSDYTAGNDKWTTFADKISVSGWSGYNVINTSGITTYGNTASSQYGHIQFIFGCDTGSTNNSYAGLQINKIFGFGGVGWTTPSTMAKTGHMYTYDSSQNVTFPAGVSAVSFTENGKTLSDTYIAKSALTTKGDMIYASNANTPARLAIGSNGQFLSVADGIPKWVNNPNTDTDKKTASSNNDAKLFLIGAAVQSADGQTTYSNSKVYTQNGILYSDSKAVLTGHATHIVTINSGKKSDNSTDISSNSGTATSGNMTVTLGDSGVAAGTYRSVTVNSKGIVVAGDQTDTDYDTKNTAGSTNSTSTLYLIGAGVQAANPQTYSNSKVYMADGTLYLTNTNDLSGTANNHPALIIGGTDTTAHLEIDANEIHAKASGNTVGPLYLNHEGGYTCLSGEKTYSDGTYLYSNSTKVSVDGHTHEVSDITDIYKQEYNLGYYDTITENSDGTYTITRQTGYIVLDGVNHKFSEKSSSKHNGMFYNHDDYVKSNALKPSNTTIDPTIICNLFETKPNDYLYNNNKYGVGMYTDGAICVGLTTAITTIDEANAYLVQNPISIQYKLATSYTEKVEKNHYSTYNQRFILDHNKSEAERSANLGYFADRQGRWWVTKQDDISEFINQLPNGTYNISADVTPLSIDSGYNVTSCFFWLQIYGGQYSSGDGIKTVIDNFTSLNQTRRGYLTFTKQSYTNYEFRLWGFGNHDGGNHGEAKCSNIMLVEGDHPYPYQAYEGKVVHEKDLENYVTTDTTQTITGYKKISSIGIDTINGATLGNAIMRQNTSTGDVILGSTIRQLRLWGNGDRPTYSKDDGASYKNLALLSDLNDYTKKTIKLSDNVDLNTVTSSGFYRLMNHTQANFPHSQMIVCRGDDTIAQMVFPYADTTMYVRTGNPFNPSGGLWHDWKQVAFTDHTHTSINTAFVFNNNDMPEAEGSASSANLAGTTNAHQISFYRNGLSVPYQMDDSNDGGILRCRGNSESNVIFELATWDNSGDGETIQFNYYPTNSQATPTYSVAVPKKTGTILLTTDSSSAGNAAADKVVARNDAGSIQTEKLAVSSGTTTKATMQYNSTDDCIEFIFA